MEKCFRDLGYSTAAAWMFRPTASYSVSNVLSMRRRAQDIGMSYRKILDFGMW